MRRTEIIIIALRLLATYLCMMGLISLPSALFSLLVVMKGTDSGSNLYLVSGALYGFVYTIFSALVWLYAPNIAKLVEKDIPPHETEEHEVTASNVMIIGLVLLGFFVLSKAIPSLVEIALAVMAPSFDTHFSKTLSGLDGMQKSLVPWSDIAAMFVQITFGVWLIFGSRGIASFLKKFRYAGR